MTYSTSTTLKGPSAGSVAAILAWATQKGCKRSADVTLGDFLPYLPSLDCADNCLRHSESFGEVDLSNDSSQRANLFRISIGKFSVLLDMIGSRQDLQMVRVDAPFVAAEVVKVESIGNRAVPPFIGLSMRKDVGAASAEPSVSSFVQITGPIPTPRFVINVIGQMKRRATLMSKNELDMLTLQNSPILVRSRRSGRWRPTTAEAQPRRILRGDRFSARCSLAADVAKAGDISAINSLFAPRARAIRGRLGVHFWDLLDRFWCAMPRAVCSSAGALRVPQLYAYSTSTSTGK